MSRLSALLRRNRLVDTLFSLRGNARACIFTEPLWGLPVNLYMPLSAKYMEALGLDALQIGIVATVYLVSQMFFSLISGAVTDRLGRRWTTTIFDIFAWVVPSLLWMNAQGFSWFVAAAAFNGFMRITDNAWPLLMVEDAPPKMLVSIYSLSHIAGLLSGFAAPLTSLFVGKENLVPTMRWLYLFALVCMVIKIVVLHLNTRETTLGRQRKEELRGKPLSSAFEGSLDVLKKLFQNVPLMLVLVLMSCLMVIRSNTQNFWPLLVTGKLGLPEGSLPLLSAIKSLVQMLCFFIIAPRLRPRYFFKPMNLGLLVILGLHLFWYFLPREASGLVYLGVMAEALEMSIILPLMSSLQMLLLDQKERSRMLGFFIAACLLITAPFGVFNGFLGRLDAGFPMLLSAALALLGILMLGKLKQQVDSKGLLKEADA